MEIKPKVLFIIHLPPPIHGAAMVGKYIQDSELINKNVKADFINLSTTKNIEDTSKGGIKKVFSLLPILAKIAKALLTKKYALCVMTLTASGVGFYKDFLVVSLLKLFRVKILYHFHNKGVETHRHGKLNHLLYSFTFKDARAILLSPLLYRDIEHYLSKKDVYFCPNGIPEAPVSVQVRGKEPITRFLFLSNMMREKGALVLLEACKILKDQHIPFECNYVGAWLDISESDFTDRVKAYGLTNEVKAHGKKTGEDKLFYLQHADVFVFPSFYHNECFPLVLLEAMQFGLPIISTLEGGIPDIVEEGKTGLLVPQQDPSALSEKMKFLSLNNNLIQEYGLAAQHKFSTNYTIDIFQKKMSDILLEAGNLPE